MGGSADLVIRTMVPDEAEAVAALYARVWRETHAALVGPAVAAYRGDWFFLDRIANFDPPPLVAMAGGRPVAFVAWRRERLRQLWVLPEARGTGLATCLLNRAETGMAAAGADRGVLDCAAGNDPARRFYERHGWQVMTTLVRPFETGAAPVPVRLWSMEKALAPAPPAGH